MFHVIDDCFVVLRSRGVFRQAKAFRRDRYLYAGFGAGFIRLMSRGATTHPLVTWEDLTASPEIQIAGDGMPRPVHPGPLVELAHAGALAA